MTNSAQSLEQVNVAILHGKPSESRYRNPELPKPHEAGWIGWLPTQLAVRGIKTVVPAINEPYLARHADWERAAASLDIDTQTVAIGHSFGSKWTQLLSQPEWQDTEINRLVLVAPWLDPNGRYPGSQTDQKIDASLAERCHNGVDVFYDEKDGDEVQQTMARLRVDLPESNVVRYHSLRGYGHFMMNNTMQSPEFPELLQLLVPNSEQPVVQ